MIEYIDHQFYRLNILTKVTITVDTSDSPALLINVME